MIHLLPFGDVSQATSQTLAASLHPIFGVPVIPHDPVDLPPSSYDSERRQHAAAQILKGLARFKTSLTQVERVLGIVSVDLFAPDLNFVFGEADPREGVAVISIARLKPEFYGLPPNGSLLRLRILKEAVHELGHTYGLGHCPDPVCVMRFSNELQETDRKGASFCPECASRRLSSQSTM
ncbi:archaemetzincin family Zn-dependent metalloprotease [Candidatus Manganitrophus noduliformans]|uniref:Archaemetzincin family Zn-dependent metalloprotease n=1 Tax=Candidatus Manganitrophus noduliformans TaxID=2606439 RepID=A0A7X6DSY1_9BACT|nr:archaemetzincin family Zn-dependent metalloprotease [Candidatus Manganitrophus noduliformans]NKE72811.1 archaemetzincin family Zn-dependent metalloprotease [Candidatus Manganitrophus noduliformans]